MNEHYEIVNTEMSSHRRNAGSFLRLRHLRLLELVASGGSLAAAARELHLSQPAVTKLLQELEASFGTPLVARGARGGCLTQGGEVVLQRLRLALAHFDAAMAGAAAAHEDQRPLLRIGVLPLAAISLLPQAIRQLGAAGRPLRLDVRESTVGGLFDALVTGQVDCIVARPDPNLLVQAAGHDLTILPLVEEPLSIAGAPLHRLTKARQVSVEQLQREDWVVAPVGSDTRRAFDSLFLDRGLMPPMPVVESMSFHTNLQMIESLGALTLAPLTAVQLYQRLGVARHIKAAQPLPMSIISLMYLSANACLPALQDFQAAMEAAKTEGQSA